MRKNLKTCVALAFALTLVACSSGRDKPSRSTTPIPEQACRVDPRKLGDVEKIEDFGNGRGCGVRNAWRVHSLQGVEMSEPAIMNCAMVNSLAWWIQKSMQPTAQRRLGERVVKLSIPSHYACRNRNNSRRGKLSEHGHGNAIDISAFHLESGEKLIVEQGFFAGRSNKKFLQSIRADACGPFRTVLGPGSNKYHDDHLHFDLQRHRNGGAYCR